MAAAPTLRNVPLYEHLASEILQQIGAGTFRAGDRLPSVRQARLQKNLSVTTVLQAYRLLEDRGVIEARPQSGYYVRSQLLQNREMATPEASPPLLDPRHVQVDELVRRLIRDSTRPELTQFGAAVPSPDLLPTARINRILARLTRLDDPRYNTCGILEGCRELRAQVARRMYLAGCRLSPDEILITSGCTEAIHLMLLTVCRPGDLVAVESPTYFGLLQSLEALGLRALEIPTHHQDGISLEALAFALEHHPVRAVLLIPNFNNPLGSRMPDEHKRRLVELLERHDIPLIEDDLYGELSFDHQRPSVCKAYDRQGLVMLCSSFSKDISPSYRVGWVAGGRYQEKIERLKFATNLGTAVLPQLAIAEFIEGGGYDHHLRKMRRAYAQRVSQMADAVLRSFPEGTRVTDPAGGFVLWVQLPEEVDSVVLYQRAVASGITLAPGHVFSATPKYRNYIRLNAAYMSAKTERDVQRLGGLIGESIGR